MKKKVKRSCSLGPVFERARQDKVHLKVPPSKKEIHQWRSRHWFGDEIKTLVLGNLLIRR